jgi:hypothetical protein
VGTIALLACGCAQRIVEPALGARRPAVARPPISSAPRRSDVARPARGGFVIAAPDGARDEIAAELARRTGFMLVVASDALTSTPPARAFYAEIHANSRRESANRIEITTAGVDENLAARLRTLYELIRDAHLRGHPGTPRVDVRVEPLDVRVEPLDVRGEPFDVRVEPLDVRGVPGDVAARLPTRTLRLELPHVARTDAREPYLAILAEFLTQAATLPAGR